VPDLLPAIEQRPITDLVLTRLRQLDGVAVYDGEILNDDGSTHPPAMSDQDPRVGPYVVWYPWGRRATGQYAVSMEETDLVYGGQATCGAGYRPDLEYLLDRVDALLNGWTPVPADGVLDGVAFGQFRRPIGFTAGSIRRDDDVSPPRFWLPDQFVCTATT
jgi:hypothetical protein